MENNYNNKDFEQFLKQNADQYRMFPSENVWKGINSALHTRRRWYGLGLALLLLMTGGGVTWVMMSTPAGKIQETEPVVIQTRDQVITNNTPAKSSHSVKAVPQGAIAFNNQVTTPVTTLPLANSGISTDILEYNENIGIDNKLTTPAGTLLTENSNTVIQSTPTTITMSADPAPLKTVSNETSTPPVAVAAEHPRLFAEVRDIYPLSIESVINSYKKPVSKKKIFWQFYVAPTVSYRKLSENKAFLRSAVNSGNVPAFVAYSDVKNVVTHKPDVGMEVGLAAKYPLGKLLKLRAGLQFNVSRYDIRAVAIQREVATIALDDGGNGSIRRLTTYRNLNGNKANWVQNFYYSASIPVGAEIKVANKKAHRYLGLAATFQPTYIISDRAYMLSTDYKNYLEVPSLIRRWNMNAGFEAFIGLTKGNTEWQIGPQVRYQIQSSFVDSYPVNENLFDFGLKIGVLFNKK